MNSVQRNRTIDETKEYGLRHHIMKWHEGRWGYGRNLCSQVQETGVMGFTSTVYAYERNVLEANENSIV